ncbi:MAG: hypothetical protein ACI382_08160, partial [Alloprevotella sp.]
GDTRIFSPLLYQLSYGTIVLPCCDASAVRCRYRLFASAKVRRFSLPPNFSAKFYRKFLVFTHFLAIRHCKTPK